VLQQVAPVQLQGVPIGAELLADRLADDVGGDAVGGGQVPGGDDDGRLADDPVLAIGQDGAWQAMVSRLGKGREQTPTPGAAPGRVGSLTVFSRWLWIMLL
jgi:hypothetical protein